MMGQCSEIHMGSFEDPEVKENLSVGYNCRIGNGKYFPSTLSLETITSIEGPGLAPKTLIYLKSLTFWP